VSHEFFIRGLQIWGKAQRSALNSFYARIIQSVQLIVIVLLLPIIIIRFICEMMIILM